MTQTLQEKLRIHPVRRITSALVGATIVPLTLYFGVPDRNGGAVAIAIGLFLICTARVLRPFPLIPPIGPGAMRRHCLLRIHLDQVTVGPTVLYERLEQFALLMLVIGSVLNVTRYF